MKFKKTLILFPFLLFISSFFRLSLATYPNLSDYPSFLSPELYIVVGEDGSASDVVASTEISTSVKGELPGINVQTKLDRDIINPYDINKNLLLIGTTCTNKIIALLLGENYPSCGSETVIPENSAIIKIYDGFKPGYYVLVVSGWNDSYTRIAASILKKHNQFLSGEYVKAVKVISDSTSGVTPYYGEMIPTTIQTSNREHSVDQSTTVSTTILITASIETTIATTVITSTIPNNQDINEPKTFINTSVIFGIVVILIIFLIFLFKIKKTKNLYNSD